MKFSNTSDKQSKKKQIIQESIDLSIKQLNKIIGKVNKNWNINNIDFNFIQNNSEILLKENTNFVFSGRIISIRKQGKITFLTLCDFNVKLQIVLFENETENYKTLISNLNLGDYILSKGKMILTKNN